MTEMDELSDGPGQSRSEREQWLAREFEEQRPRLRAVAHRVLGSASDADDAVQEAWLRLSRSDTSEIANLARLADDGRRADQPRPAAFAGLTARAQTGMPAWRSSTPAATPRVRGCTPPQRPTRPARPSSPTASAWRCSSSSTRSRRRSGSPSCCTTSSVCRSRRSPASSTAPPQPPVSWRAEPAVGCGLRTPTPQGPARTRQREVVTAFLAAARGGDFTALLELLHPDVVLTSDAAAVAMGSPDAAARA